MLENGKKNRKKKVCYKCLKPVTANTRKCLYCGNVFKSTRRFLFDKIKGIFDIQRVYSPNQISAYQNEKPFFTPDDVDRLFIDRNFKILIYMVLSDLNYLDESSLIDLGETLVAIEKINHQPSF